MFAEWESAVASTPPLVRGYTRVDVAEQNRRAAQWNDRVEGFAIQAGLDYQGDGLLAQVVRRNALLPLAYGYLRADLIDDGDRAERRMILAARELGFQLAAVFREQPHQAAVPPAYLDLVCECCRAEAHTVITPPGHLSGMAVPRIVLLDLLAVRAHALVCEVAL